MDFKTSRFDWLGHLEIFLYRNEVWLKQNLKKVYSGRNML